MLAVACCCQLTARSRPAVLSKNLGVQVGPDSNGASGLAEDTDSDEDDSLESRKAEAEEGRTELKVIRELEGQKALGMQLRLLHSWEVA